jgi:OFA family oxalate/formate antiporter-like MFS transporter
MILSVIVIAFLLVINAGYGGGFSTLPALLSERFGMKRISQIHGLSLSAWAVAGLTGNNTSEIILKASDNNYQNIVIVGAGLYIVALVICVVMVSKRGTWSSDDKKAVHLDLCCGHVRDSCVVS